MAAASFADLSLNQPMTPSDFPEALRGDSDNHSFSLEDSQTNFTLYESASNAPPSPSKPDRGNNNNNNSSSSKNSEPVNTTNSTTTTITSTSTTSSSSGNAAAIELNDPSAVVNETASTTTTTTTAATAATTTATTATEANIHAKNATPALALASTNSSVLVDDDEDTEDETTFGSVKQKFFVSSPTLSPHGEMNDEVARGIFRHLSSNAFGGDPHTSIPVLDRSLRAESSFASPKSRASNQFEHENSIDRNSLQSLAANAVRHRELSVGEMHFAEAADNVRDSVRRVQAYSRREAPVDHRMTADVVFRKKACVIEMDNNFIRWYRGKKVFGTIDTDDIVGAQAVDQEGVFRIHFFIKGKGKGAKALYRQPKSHSFRCDHATRLFWVRTIQDLVRFQARAPPITERRRIRVVINPHSGKRRARQIWTEKVKFYFDLAGFDCHLEETTHAGHAIEMGQQFVNGVYADEKVEALVFIGGDGTLMEFMNGLLARPEHEWKEIITTTPISLISAGTQNAFGKGVGIPTVEAAVYCIIKHKMRPLDVIAAVSEQHPEQVQFSYCGMGWGVAGDVAEESEKYRWLGTKRYAFLKIKRGVFFAKRHHGTIRYIPTDPQPKLRVYDDIRDEGALDQFEVEEGNVYDIERSLSNANTMLGMSGINGMNGISGGAHGRSQSMVRPSWRGFTGALRSPASVKRFLSSQWKEESGRYLVVGALNTAPDAKYVHPSDGNLDLIISRKGNLLQSIQLGILYLMGQELKSPLMSYIKAKAVVIEQQERQNHMNIDGEILPGPGPWRMEIVPSLFKALSEK